MDNIEETLTGRNQKTAIAVLIGILLIAGLLLFLWRYSSVLGSTSQQIVKNPLQQNAVSLTQIKEDYETNFSRIVGGYLKADSNGSDFASLTSQTKEQLLGLRVPAIYKDSHLSTVLVFSNIESALAQGDSTTVLQKISELKKIDQGFSSVSN